MGQDRIKYLLERQQPTLPSERPNSSALALDYAGSALCTTEMLRSLRIAARTVANANHLPAARAGINLRGVVRSRICFSASSCGRRFQHVVTVAIYHRVRTLSSRIIGPVLTEPFSPQTWESYIMSLDQPKPTTMDRSMPDQTFFSGH